MIIGKKRVKLNLMNKTVAIPEQDLATNRNRRVHLLSLSLRFSFRWHTNELETYSVIPLPSVFKYKFANMAP